jgi:hypothetical protein
MARRDLSLAFSCLALAVGGAGMACSKSGSAAQGGNAGAEACAVSDNDAIRLALEPTCKACHDVGSNMPAFASLDAFENLIVYDPALVTPGDPAKSKLVALLRGTATGTYTQMPLTGKAFAKLDPATTGISIDAIEAWIEDLAPPDPSRAAAHPDSPTTRRLRVEELVIQMQSTLGYPEVGATDDAAGKPQALWVRDPDALGSIGYSNIGATRTWSILGGGDSLARVRDDQTWSPSALRTAVQMSLSWCGEQVGKSDAAIFRDASPSDTSALAPDKIRKNIAYLHLRLLGEKAEDADVKSLYEGVFLSAEPRGAAVAWTEVCAALVRDPRFLTF